MPVGYSMSKIIFIQPPITSYQRYGYLGTAVGNLQPLNLCYLAASSRRAGFDSEIIDSPALGLGVEDAAGLVIKKSPKYVGITANSCSVNNAGVLARLIKRHNNNIITVLGGTHISSLPKETMSAFDGFDVGVIGEGEEVMVNLSNALENMQDLRQVKGIIFRNNGDLVVTPGQQPIADLDCLPVPAWDLLPDFSRYVPSLVRLRKLPAALLVTSRGCNKSCLFCDRSVFGKSVRSHSPDYIVELIKYLSDRFKVREIVFKDPDFAHSREQILEFCHKLINSRIDIKWNCMVRADSVDRQVLSAMKSSGCWQISLGIESGAQEILDFLKRGMRLEQIRDSVMLMKELGFNIVGYIMLGSPLESVETIKETIDFLGRLGLDSIKVNFFTPYPGSAIYKHIGKLGVFNDDWNKLNAAHPVFIPFNLTEAKLRYFSKKILKKFYFRPRVVFNYLKRALHLKVTLRYLFGLIGFGRHISGGNEKIR